MKKKLIDCLKSRRWWTCVGACVVVLLHDVAGVAESQAQAIVAIAISWALSDSLKKTE